MVPLKNYMVMWMDDSITGVNQVEKIEYPDNGVVFRSSLGDVTVFDKSKIRFIVAD